jgi:hypothetical protein
MRGETSDLALGEHTHRRAHKDALLGCPIAAPSRGPVTVNVMPRSR